MYCEFLEKCWCNHMEQKCTSPRKVEHISLSYHAVGKSFESVFVKVMLSRSQKAT